MSSKCWLHQSNEQVVTMNKHFAVFVCLVFQAAVPKSSTLAANIPALKSEAEPYIAGDPHIVGGKEAKPHSHPYQVGLLLNPYNIDKGFCGGSLLSDTWVVTAAHCTQSKYITEVAILAGAHRIKEREDVTQTLSIKSVFQHPEYDEDRIKNDISLIRLAFPANLTDYVQPIRLPSEKQRKWWFWNQKVTLSGWGYVSDGMKEVASTLQEVDATTTPNFLCSLAYAFQLVYNTNICASGWYLKGTCNGDSGGPMTITESDGSRTLIGVSSFGSRGGCETRWPTVFARVSSFLDWIHNTTQIPWRL